MIALSRKRLQLNKIKVALLILATGLHLSTSAQDLHLQFPLQQFFQEHYDSTIIYHQGSSWQPPDYFIIAKKDTQVASFRYTRPYRFLGRQYPSVLANKFIIENVKYEQVRPDTNLYFKIHEASINSRKEGWRAINAFDIWSLASSMNDTLVNCQIYDGSYDTYYLITKNKIKMLEYYEADFFEECEGANVNRQKEILTKKALLQFFN